MTDEIKEEIKSSFIDKLKIGAIILVVVMIGISLFLNHSNSLNKEDIKRLNDSSQEILKLTKEFKEQYMKNIEMDRRLENGLKDRRLAREKIYAELINEYSGQNKEYKF